MRDTMPRADVGHAATVMHIRCAAARGEHQVKLAISPSKRHAIPKTDLASGATSPTISKLNTQQPGILTFLLARRLCDAQNSRSAWFFKARFLLLRQGTGSSPCMRYAMPGADIDCPEALSLPLERAQVSTLSLSLSVSPPLAAYDCAMWQCAVLT